MFFALGVLKCDFDSQTFCFVNKNIEIFDSRFCGRWNVLESNPRDVYKRQVLYYDGSGLDSQTVQSAHGELRRGGYYLYNNHKGCINAADIKTTALDASYAKGSAFDE